MPAAYRERPPADALRPWVRCVWTATARSPDSPGAGVLPDGCSDIVWRTGVDPFVAGPDTSAKPAGLPSAVRVIGLRFHPGAAAGPLGVPLSELRDARVDLALLWGAARARALAERLEAAAEPDRAMAVLEAALRERLGETPDPDPAVVAHARSLERGTPHRVELPVRERQLRRRFVTAVGYGPKTFERIARLQRFLALAGRARGPRPGLAALACASGYADQAHLTRECRRLTHQTPAALLASR